jgi:hypothetical protein
MPEGQRTAASKDVIVVRLCHAKISRGLRPARGEESRSGRTLITHGNEPRSRTIARTFVPSLALRLRCLASMTLGPLGVSGLSQIDAAVANFG